MITLHMLLITLCITMITLYIYMITIRITIRTLLTLARVRHLGPRLVRLARDVLVEDLDDVVALGELVSRHARVRDIEAVVRLFRALVGVSDVRQLRAVDDCGSERHHVTQCRLIEDCENE